MHSPPSQLQPGPPRVRLRPLRAGGRERDPAPAPGSRAGPRGRGRRAATRPPPQI